MCFNIRMSVLPEEFEQYRDRKWRREESLKVDTAEEVDYYKNGGILPYVLRNLLKGDTRPGATAIKGRAAA